MEGPLHKIRRSFKKVKAAFQFYKTLDRTIEFELKEADLYKARILQLLQSKIGPSHYDTLLATELADSIVKMMEANDEPLLMARAAKYFGPLTELAVHKTGLLCGVASLWELNFKFFAHKVDVEVFEERRREIRTTNLSDVYKAVILKIPRAKTNIDFLADARHCLFHGNFKQLRAILEPRLSPEDKAKLDSGMFALHLAQNRPPTAADKPMANQTAIELGPFFWFLSGGSSELIDLTVREFEHGLAQLETLTLVHAASFGPCIDAFQQLAVTGTKLTSSQEEALFNQIQSFSPNPALTKELFLRKLGRLFKSTDP